MSTQAFTVGDDLNGHLLSNVIEEDEERDDMKSESNMDVEDAIDENDFSFDDEEDGQSRSERRTSDGVLSSVEDRPGNEIALHHFYNRSDDHSQASSVAVGQHPLEDGDNFGDVVEVEDRELIDDEYMLSVKLTCDRSATNQLNEYLSSSSEKNTFDFETLYKTRGREIDGLNEQLALVIRSSKKGCDKLSKALQVTKLKLDKVTSSEKRLQALVANYEDKMSNLNSDQNNNRETIDLLEITNSELHCELATAKATIASLEQQAVDLKSVNSLARCRQMHDDVVQKLHNQHNAESDRMTAAYKVAVAKTSNLQQELQMVNAELRVIEERHASIVRTKDMTIKSLQMSLKTMKPDEVPADPSAADLRIQNAELTAKLESLQSQYDITKKNLDCCDLVNKIRIYKDTVFAEDSIEHLGLIKAIDFGNLSAANTNDNLTEVISPKEAPNHIEQIVVALQKSVYYNKKLREEKHQQQQLLSQKEISIDNLQAVIKDQRQQIQLARQDAKNAPAVVSLQRQNDMLHELLKETVPKEVEQRDKSTNACEIDENRRHISSETDENCKDVSIHLIDKYRTSLQKEKVKNDQQEAYYKAQIKELMDKIATMAASTASTALASDGTETTLSSLRIMTQQYAQQIETLRVEKQLLVANYENDLRNIADTLMDKEGEVEEMKNHLKSHETTCELMNSVISELQVSEAKLSKQNDSLKKQLVTAKEYIKGKLKYCREKYNCQMASWEKYKIKADDRIDYYHKEAQRIATEANKSNLATIEGIRSWLHDSRDNVVVQIDDISRKLKKAPISSEMIANQRRDLFTLKDLVLKLTLKPIETYF